MTTYETRRDTIVTNARHALGLGSEDREQTTKTVQDAANNAYIEDMSDSDWLAATLKRLGTFKRPGAE